MTTSASDAVGDLYLALRSRGFEATQTGRAVGVRNRKAIEATHVLPYAAVRKAQAVAGGLSVYFAVFQAEAKEEFSPPPALVALVDGLVGAPVERVAKASRPFGEPAARHRVEAVAVDPVVKTLRSFLEPAARHRVDAITIDFAERALERIREGGLIVERVVSTAEGEVAFYFVGNERTPGGAYRRYGTIVCDADAGLAALYEDRITGDSKVWEVPAGDLDEALGIIGSFIKG